MHRRLAMIGIAALATGGTLAALVLAAPATADKGAAPAAVSPEIVTAMQRDFKLSPDQVRLRLANEAKAAGTESKLSRSLGAQFAGAWLNADATVLSVAVTDSAKADFVRSSGAQPVLVGRTLADLDKAKGSLDKAARPATTVASWYVDVTTNKVVVVAQNRTDGAAFVSASGVDASMVEVVVTSETPRTLYDVRGGDAYYMGGRCSVGLSVNGGFVTAGHCGTTGTATQGYNQVAQGTFAGSSFPGNDYAWVRTNSNWTPQPWVNNYSGGNVIVAGSTESAVGASICRSGSTTGWHCGTVGAKNSTVNYPQGTVNGLTRTNVCAEPGDSGGGWVSGNQGQGVTSGGSGNCTSGGTTYFQPLNEILSVYGLTLRTGTGGTPPPTTPPGGTCSGYQNTYNGSLSSGGSAYQPNGSYYQSTVSGTHRACLDGPSGTDFDLYLQKWNGSAWANVASGTSASDNESVSYSGTAGYYRYRVHAYRGSGSYSLGITRP